MTSHERPTVPGLVDRFGRVATDLRVSLTDRCNLRCTYCMPEQGLAWLPKPTLLTDDEVIAGWSGSRCTQLGITEVRFTGGEPLLRPGIVADRGRGRRSCVRAPGCRSPPTASGWPRSPGRSPTAGLDRVNVSLDTLRPDRFETLARRQRLDDVLDGVRAADAAGLRPVKLNAVLMRGVNDDEAVELLRFAVEHGYELRFIEQMPLDAQHAWRRDGDGHVATRSWLSSGPAFTLSPRSGRAGIGPGRRPGWWTDYLGSGRGHRPRSA